MLGISPCVYGVLYELYSENEKHIIPHQLPTNEDIISIQDNLIDKNFSANSLKKMSETQQQDGVFALPEKMTNFRPPKDAGLGAPAPFSPRPRPAGQISTLSFSARLPIYQAVRLCVCLPLIR